MLLLAHLAHNDGLLALYLLLQQLHVILRVIVFVYVCVCMCVRVCEFWYHDCAGKRGMLWGPHTYIHTFIYTDEHEHTHIHTSTHG